MKRLKTGVAYHGNRLLSHAIEDMREIVRADMDIVVHMFTHNDWDRHDKVVADIFRATEDLGLEVWVDNWGIGGAPGDKSHFLGYHPEAHTYYGDGIMHPYQICLNAPSYRQFVKDWVDKVASMGGKTVFWDEPRIPDVPIDDTRTSHYSACTCPTCKRMFEERFGRKMPIVMDADVARFRDDTMVDFHNFITEYAAKAGMQSVICFMPHQLSGINSIQTNPLLGTLDISRIAQMPNVSNIGTDPYWFSKKGLESPYKYVYDVSRACVETADRFGKDHNIWIQAYNAPLGREPEIIDATEAAYDAGARNILYWSFHAGESNNYRSASPERSWQMTIEANRRIKWQDRDRIHAENLKKYAK